MSSTLRFSSNFQSTGFKPNRPWAKPRTRSPLQVWSRVITTSTALFGPTGTTSLVQLENQILTLRSTIITVTPLEVMGDQAENDACTGIVHGQGPSDQSTQILVLAQDFSNLQQEYNKLMFQKHKVWSRSSLISKAFIGLSFQIHNGSKFVLLKVTSKMVGYRFGEFVPSRKVTIHKEAKKKK